MSALFWQLAWAGPRMQGSGWAVMPDPALGNARLACVPVEERDGHLVVTLPETDPVDTVCAPLNEWTRAELPATGAWSALLCLLGYDQPSGKLGGNFVHQPAQPLSLGVLDFLGPHLEPTGMQVVDNQIDGDVTVKEVQEAINRFDRTSHDELFGQVIRPPVLPPRLLPGQVTLAFASCQYPAGFMDRGPAEASLHRLEKQLGQRDAAPGVLLLVGDQIYADATAGLIDPIRMDDRYRVPYEEWLRIEPLRRIMSRIPVLTMLDDHEINDNWEPYREGATGPMFEEGVHAFWSYQRMLKLRRSHALRKKTWFQQRHAVEGWSLFMADSRSRRPWRTAATLADAQILGDRQMDQLRKWLVDGVRKDDLKLVATPAMLLPRVLEHQDTPLHLDNWQGYPTSLYGLLAYICENDVRDVCFLSGDAHLGCDVRIHVARTDGTRAVDLRSIHSPALYAPMPFANEQLHNLALGTDRFDFVCGAHRYVCEVVGQAFLPLRDGCCLLEATRGSTGWTVNCRVL